MPCDEKTLSIDLTSSSTKGKERVTYNTALRFYFEDLEKTYITEVPSYDIPTLLYNFGGALGLMVGVSAISILEISTWFMLFFVDRIYLLYQKIRSECDCSTENDSMV